MKKSKTNSHNAIGHGSIQTQYIYAENNQVYLKKDVENEEWFPINFQWMPVVQLKENLINQ